MRPTSAVDVLAVISLWSACAAGQNKLQSEIQSEIPDILFSLPVQTLKASHHCLHSPSSQVSPTLSSWLSWRQRGGQGPGSQALCWTSSNWQSVPSVSENRDLIQNSNTVLWITASYLVHWDKNRNRSNPNWFQRFVVILIHIITKN